MTKGAVLRGGDPRDHSQCLNTLLEKLAETIVPEIVTNGDEDHTEIPIEK
jgi:hypothetical protein